jgi:plasmid segregation protein ParM
VVGRDAYLETLANYERTRLTHYSQTDGYRALTLGAISISGLREIDQLVIGLPISTLATYHAQMAKQYVGEHLIGAIGAKRKVAAAVSNVTVISQPAGAMLDAVNQNPALRKSTNLVIDMGYYTMDFLICKGLKPFYPRSGAVEGGMSGYYDHLAELVQQKITGTGMAAANRIDHFRLENAISAPQLLADGSATYQFQVGRKMVDITEGVLLAQSRLVEYLDRMITTLGGSTFGTITAVILAGGGARLLLPVIEKLIGDDHEYVVLKDSQYAIANGYAHLAWNLSKRAEVAAVE